LRRVELELTPSQPDEVVQALSELLTPPSAEPDPWWQAGIAEALES
jgi:hypothetical protein